MVPPQLCRSLGKRNLVVVSGKMGAIDDALGPIEPLSAQDVVCVLSSVTLRGGSAGDGEDPQVRRPIGTLGTVK